MNKLTDITVAVNRFGQSVCGLGTTHLRTDSKATANKVLPKAGQNGFDWTLCKVQHSFFD